MAAPVAHEHACLVYQDPAEMREKLASYTTAGVSANEATVFVHGWPSDEEALAFLAEGPTDFGRLLHDHFFLVSNHRDAFERGGRIDVGHVASVVADIVRRAERDGRSGARIFVDASRVYLRGGREREWFAFEEALGRRLHQRVALVCAYEAGTLDDPGRLDSVLRAHLYRFEG